MSVDKLLTRIINPLGKVQSTKSRESLERLHESTYGLATDPLIHFACVFSALVHDCGHRGVANNVLSKEDPGLARRFHGKAVAEQYSVELAWKTLNQSKYDSLRRCLFVTVEEANRFRKLVVNSVIATDIFDQDLARSRKERWTMMFEEVRTGDNKVDIDRKATIVLEHLIQASDVAHCTQHVRMLCCFVHSNYFQWHVYRKWNTRLFLEMYAAYTMGRSDFDPSTSWYEGELGFFDNYIIPLARKLKECGVFGVSSDEYLAFALENRAEWATKGRTIVKEMVESAPSSLRTTI